MENGLKTQKDGHLQIKEYLKLPEASREDRSFLNVFIERA